MRACFRSVTTALYGALVHASLILILTGVVLHMPISAGASDGRGADDFIFHLSPMDTPAPGKYLAATETKESTPGGAPIRPLVPDSPSTSASGVLKLTVRDIARLMMERNEEIRSMAAELNIRQQAVTGAKSEFDPEIFGSAKHDDIFRRNTVAEVVAQGFLPIYSEQAENYQAGLEQRVPTGAKLKLDYLFQHTRSNLQERFGVDNQYLTLLGASISQPLLKGAGTQVNYANINIAQTDADMAMQQYRERSMRILAQAIVLYWDLKLAHERYQIRANSARIAKQLLDDNNARFRTGKMAMTEVLEAEAGWALRRSLSEEAQQQKIVIQNQLRTLMSSSVTEQAQNIDVVDPLNLVPQSPKFDESLSRAYKLRPEYLSSMLKLSREDIRVVYAKNQRLYQLDLQGSYQLNGLGDEVGEANDNLWDPNFRSWMVGVELRIPLGGRKSKSELAAARQRKRQALLELKSVEVALANALDAAIQNVYSTTSQARYYASVVDANRKLLEAEVKRFHAGHSNSRLLLEKEENLIRAREAEYESLVNHKKAELELTLSEGALLLDNGVELMEVKQ